jgi:hypothetical protein
MAFCINYEKRKNVELFKSMQKKSFLNLTDAQNYIPIYTKFFSLNEKNYNSVNLNHSYYIESVSGRFEERKNVYSCVIKNVDDQVKPVTQPVFIKLAPLLDSFKYLVGKYDVSDKNLFELPKYSTSSFEANSKLLDSNNSAYVDGLFVFLSSNLLYKYKFIHGLEYYGSFLGIKNNFEVNVIDDIEYLDKSVFFTENKNKLFNIEDYSHLLDSSDGEMKKPTITIDKNVSNRSTLSIQSINEDLYSDLFSSTQQESDSDLDSKIITLADMKELSLEMIDVNDNSEKKITTIKTNSTCSSRTSHTSNESDKNFLEEDECDNCDSEESVWTNESGEEKGFDCVEQEINATIPKFPVNVICMEYCEDTFDSLIENNPDLPQEEWFSALMQVIMILITYQQVFSFTHNDLHTNNIMYNSTKRKYVYYCYKKKYYKVPTYGRIFKIIDFGRGIYKFDKKLFCSDSFQPGADAATQYNTEPYFNSKKARLEPNYSFDLCRLACSIFDYIVEDIDEVSSQNIGKCSPIVKLINDWCLDDAGVNILYKNNGAERYPDFKLYKMIARLVHNHTPQAQLERKEFSKYVIPKNKLDEKAEIMNIDEIPSLV